MEVPASNRLNLSSDATTPELTDAGGQPTGVHPPKPYVTELETQRRGPPAFGPVILCVPSMGAVLKGFKSPVCKPNMISNEHGNISRSQGGPGDRPAERRLRENREPMNKNRIEGRRDRASWHNTAKPFGWVSEVNAAVVRGRTASLPGETCPARAGQESAAAIVVCDKPGAAKPAETKKPEALTP
jgi:hypothetical protein